MPAKRSPAMCMGMKVSGIRRTASQFRPRQRGSIPRLHQVAAHPPATQNRRRGCNAAPTRIPFRFPVLSSAGSIPPTSGNASGRGMSPMRSRRRLPPSASSAACKDSHASPALGVSIRGGNAKCPGLETRSGTRREIRASYPSATNTESPATATRGSGLNGSGNPRRRRIPRNSPSSSRKLPSDPKRPRNHRSATGLGPGGPPKASEARTTSPFENAPRNA